MTQYKGIMALVVETAEEKGVRFDVADFQDGEVECLNQDVVIFRGRAGQIIDRLFQRREGGLPCEKVGNGDDVREVNSGELHRRWNEDVIHAGEAVTQPVQPPMTVVN
jgi:hypothetical protein